MSADLKEKVRRIVSERGLCSCMNDTKWNELRNAMMTEMPFQPPYTVKFLFDTVTDDFTEDVYHTMDWHYAYAIEGEAFNGAFAIEWVKIRPRYLKARGRLTGPEVISAETELEDILKKYSIPYEAEDGVYCIYGYKGSKKE